MAKHTAKKWHGQENSRETLTTRNDIIVAKIYKQFALVIRN